MKHEDLEAELMNERGYGTEDMVNSFEAAYLKSCAHNDVGPDNMEYFRRYFWNILALQQIKIERIANHIFREIQDEL